VYEKLINNYWSWNILIEKEQSKNIQMLVNGFFEEYLDIFYINSSALNAGNYRGVVNIQKLVFRPIVYVSQSEEKVMLSVSIFIGKMAKIVNSELRKKIDVTAREKTIKQLKYGYKQVNEYIIEKDTKMLLEEPLNWDAFFDIKNKKI